MKQKQRAFFYSLPLLLSLLPAPALRAATAWVETPADSGDYSLRGAITAINATGAPANTITWDSGSAGTLTLLSDLPAVNYASVWNLNGYNFIIAASTNAMSVAAALTIHNDSAQSTVTVHEDIYGAGSLTKTGDGVLVLTGTNTYTGGTAINGGVLLTDKDASLGSLAGALSLDGGTLKVMKDFSSARAITLGPGGGVFNTDAYAMTLSGLISGAGALAKNGAGTLTLGGTNTYLGTTSVNAGTLRLAADNALPQGSTVTLAAGATLDLDVYTATVAAYSGPGTLAVKLLAGTTNLTVTGGASLAGGYLSAAFSPQLISAGQRFTVLTAGNVTGEFGGVYSPALVSLTPDYSDPARVVLTAALVPFTGIGATGNQDAVGAMLEPLRAGAAGDLATVIGNMYVLDAAGVRSALDQTGPVAVSALRGLAFSGSALRSNALRARTSALAAGTAQKFSSYSGRGADLDYIDFDELPRDTARKSAPGRTDGESRSPIAFFASVSGLSGRDMSAKGGGGERPGYAFDGSGLLAGADYSVTEHLALGIMAGYDQGKADVYYPSEADLERHSARYGAYAAAAAGPLRLDLYAGRAKDSFKSSRRLVFGELARTAQGDTDGQETNLEGSLTWQFRTLTPQGRMAPFVTVNYDKLETEAFTETGAGALDLEIRGLQASSLRSAAGLRYSEAISAGDYTVRTVLSAAWTHEFRDQSLAVTSSLDGGESFTVNSGDSPRDALKSGAKIAAEFKNGVSLGLDYSGDFRRRLRSHLLALGCSVKF